MWRAVVLAVGVGLAGCADRPERAVSAGDVWAAAGVKPTLCSAPDNCLGYTPVPPGALRERVGAAEWTARRDDLVTVVADLRLTMSESVGGTWMLNVSPLSRATPDAPPQPEVPAAAAQPEADAPFSPSFRPGSNSTPSVPVGEP